jgi:hypothetical protein
MINKKYMKHLLNNLSEHEKNHIREQHTDKIKIDTSKFRKLMESKLGDVKLISEQDTLGGPKRNIEKDLERDDVLHLLDKNNSKDEAIVLQSPQPNQGLLVNHKGKKTQFVFGPANNQIRFAGKTEPGDFDFTIDSVEINGKSFPVSSDGSF